MYSDDSTESRQKNELEAVQAIYGEDLKDLRKKAAWNKWTPLNLSITLRPQKGSSGFKEAHVQIDLHIVCLANYPNSVPEILLENGKGLSTVVIKTLQNDLVEKAIQLKGEEMIFELCQYVEEFLHLHNKPTSKSFYDEMLQRQKEKEQQDIQAKQIEENRQRKHILEEVQRRQEILKSEFRLRKESRVSVENSTENGSDSSRRISISRRKTNSSTDSSDESLCIHKGTSVTEFYNNGSRKIYRGQCIAHSFPNHVVFTGVDSESGEIVVINEWSIEVKSDDTIHRQVSSIEQEMNYLTKLKHQNLAHYFNVNHNFINEDNKLIIHTLKEFIYGSNCKTLFFNENFAIDISFLKHIAKGVLTALEYLHRNNVVHKNITESCVYLNEKVQFYFKDRSENRKSTWIQDRIWFKKRVLDLEDKLKPIIQKKISTFNEISNSVCQ